ncbi:hypothetical protein V6N13_074262 [Hibiscus sabdariffa]
MTNSTISLGSILEKEKLNDMNFLNWYQRLGTNSPRASKNKFEKHMDDMLDVGCLVLATITLELQMQQEYVVSYEMIQNLKENFEGKARQ